MTTTSIQFRPLAPTDAPLLSEVALRAYRQHYLHLWHDGGAWYINRCFTVDEMRAEMADPNSAWFLVEEAGEPVGFIKLNIDKPLEGDETQNALELERIYLVQEATGRGVGRAALEFIFDFARQRGKTLVWLKAMDSSTDAIAVYTRLGFALCGTHQLDFEAMKREFWGMVVMKKPV
ncbi:MAG: GNAT family N-acetyltransferase [Bacteroidetes bacterium]|nr:GNAT family N-acetyltransferase [Fibrella sp.]